MNYCPQTYVLSCCLLKPSLWPILADRLIPTDFDAIGCRDMYDAMSDTVRQYGKLVPELSLLNFAKEIKSAHGAATRFLSYAPTVCFFDQYCQAVIRQVIERKEQEFAAALMNGTDDEKEDAKQALDATEQRLSVLQNPDANQSSSINALATEHLHRKLDGKDPPFVPLAIHKIDQFTDYTACEGDTIVVGAVPGHGKTLFVLQSLERCSEVNRKAVFYSFEMSGDAIGKRVIAMRSNLEVNEDTAAEIHEHINAFPDVMFRTVPPNIGRLIADMRDQHRRGAKAFGIDYLGLVKGQGNGRYEQQSDAISQIATLNAELSTTTFVACQLNRPVDKTHAFIPRIHNLRDSGQIEAAASAIILLRYPHKDEGATEDAINATISRCGATGVDASNYYEVRVPKLRNGQSLTAPIVCKFQSSPLRIVDNRAELHSETF